MKKIFLIFFMLGTVLLTACGEAENSTKTSNTKQQPAENQKNNTSRVLLDTTKKMKSSGNIKIEVYQKESENSERHVIDEGGTIAVTKKNPRIGFEISHLKGDSATMVYLDGGPYWKYSDKGDGFGNERIFSTSEGANFSGKNNKNQYFSEGEHTLLVIQFEAPEGDYSLPTNQAKIVDSQTLHYTVTYPE